MARDIARGREDDAPGQAGRRAPELAVHEIGEPPEEQAERDAAGDIIVDAQPIELLPPRHVEDAEADADDAAVERHAAIPQPHDLDRIVEIFDRLVEQDIAEPPAQDDAERARRRRGRRHGGGPSARRAASAASADTTRPGRCRTGRRGCTSAAPAGRAEARSDRARDRARAIAPFAVAMDVSKASIKASPSGFAPS